jgi:hypothetical protein
MDGTFATSTLLHTAASAGHLLVMLRLTKTAPACVACLLQARDFVLPALLQP